MLTFDPLAIADGTARAVLERGEFPDSRTAALADIARDPKARRAFDNATARFLGSVAGPDVERPAPARVDEVVVGGGLHAAIYALTMFARLGRRIVVLDDGLLGGAFAYDGEVFYLNSRNRGNELGVPGTGAALNVIPNGIIQPADIDGAEYQTNLQFAFAIRANLVMLARPYGQRVGYIERRFGSDDGARYFIATSNMAWETDRVLLATGVGTPRMLPAPGCPTTRIYDFTSFMTAMTRDEFPLRGWRNVAVIGAGESGNSVVEMLVGQGPMRGGPASLDTVENITWFGQQCTSKEEFEGYDEPGARSRYAGIGRFFPRDDDPGYYHRIQPVASKAARLVPGDDGIRVLSQVLSRSYGPFDHVVVCIGFENRVNDLVRTSVDEFLTRREWDLYPLREETVYAPDGTAIARRFANTEIYKIGPCADLPVTRQEREAVPVLARIPTNSASCFRYAERTMRLAGLHADAALGVGAGGYASAPNPAPRRKIRFENG